LSATRSPSGTRYSGVSERQAYARGEAGVERLPRVTGEGPGHRAEAPDAGGAGRLDRLLLDAAQRRGHPAGGAPSLPGEGDQQRAAVRVVEGAGDPGAILEAVEDAGERRGTVAQTAVQLADGVRGTLQLDHERGAGASGCGHGGDGTAHATCSASRAAALRTTGVLPIATDPKFPDTIRTAMEGNDLSDDEFLAAVDHCAFGPHEFPHRAHLRLAYLSVRHHGPAGGEAH